MATPDAGTFVIEGPQTLPHAAATRLTISDRLLEGPASTIDCSGVTQADISFVQILLSLRTSGPAGGAPVLIHRRGGPLEAVLRRGGFLHDEAADLPFWELGKVAS